MKKSIFLRINMSKNKLSIRWDKIFRFFMFLFSSLLNKLYKSITKMNLIIIIIIQGFFFLSVFPSSSFFHSFFRVIIVNVFLLHYNNNNNTKNKKYFLFKLNHNHKKIINEMELNEMKWNKRLLERKKKRNKLTNFFE